ncbi:GNAT family N-acetyltransferase [Devriesea agamarum]|uniref:GNAT family N-acetyltransferase n=1 Tax=Devriesea agamarum TaxID=472569 RepID=UPI00071CB8E0|nr:GNAT family protein [Devriesea agamarum]
MVSHHWPVELREEQILLRPLRRRDENAWREVRTRNAQWLQPWEPTGPLGSFAPPNFTEYRKSLAHQAKHGLLFPFAIEYAGHFVGQVTGGHIVRGALSSMPIGYWIDRAVAGRGITPVAVALLTDYCFREQGLHRIEINVRPENAPSLRVVEKLGLRDEGLRKAYLHIDGAWRDHRSFALCAEEVPHGLRARLAERERRPGQGRQGRR